LANDQPIGSTGKNQSPRYRSSIPITDSISTVASWAKSFCPIGKSRQTWNRVMKWKYLFRAIPKIASLRPSSRPTCRSRRLRRPRSESDSSEDSEHFLDWGYSKDLLLPFREQLGKVRTGDKVLVHVFLDDVSSRIVASARTNRYLNKRRPEYDTGDEVSLIIQEETPLGFMAIVDGEFRGLLHRERISKKLRVGEKYNGYIAAMKPEAKIDLSLEPIGYRRVTSLGDRILKEMDEQGGLLPFSDKSPPEKIRDHFRCQQKGLQASAWAHSIEIEKSRSKKTRSTCSSQLTRKEAD
jgi:hypothetical protein